MASLSYSKKAKGPCWTFISDEDNNVFVFRFGKKMEVNGYTFPRVISLELVTEEQLQETSLEIPISDAIYIMFADQKQVILKVSNFRSTKGEFTEEFKNAKTSITFLKVFLDLTTTNSELIPDANDLDDTGISTCMMTEDSEVIPDTQHCAKTPQSTRKIHIPPIMSLPVSANTSVDVHENEQSMNEICNKVFEGTYRVKLSQISDAPDEIRFQDVDEMFVKEMKNDIKEFSSPQPLALLLVNQSNLDVHSGNLTNVNDEKYVCIGGNHLRSAYQLCGKEFADAKIYTGLTDEECLIVSRVYNDMGHFIKKMTNLDLILLLRRQLNPKTSERTTDVNIIKEWRSIKIYIHICHT
ncbi:uncharacterized protein [Mytilus edulis]|uniref:uncharacterized protein n=1 Tax=Mytilus edulis TaxID=6550 RepID=UPI0039EE6874